MTTTQTPRIALIGAGAIAEALYLPALARFPDVMRELILVDSNPARLDTLASRFGVGHRQSDYKDIPDRVDGAIVALPHQLHHPVSIALLSQQIHVLCEKPLAETAALAKDMVARADSAGVTLSVNNTRRLFPAYRKIKELISSGDIGELESIEYLDGSTFNWPTASGFYFQGRKRGVLFDRGVHGLDAICWWLGAKPNLISSENDSLGGVEGVAYVKFEYRQCTGNVVLNWLNPLSNRFRIAGEQGTIESGIEDWWTFSLKSKSGMEKQVRTSSPEKSYDDFGVRLVANWIDVIGGRAQPLIPARDVVDSLELIDQCYDHATRFEMPWYDRWETHDGR